MNHNLHQEKKLVYFVSNVLHFLQYIHTFPVLQYVNLLTCRKERPTLYTATVQWGSKSLIIMYHDKHTYKIRASGFLHNTTFGCCIQICDKEIYSLGMIFLTDVI